MRLFDNSSRWLVFAIVAIAMSYTLRILAVLSTRAGVRKLDTARKALGLAPLPAREKKPARPAAEPSETH